MKFKPVLEGRVSCLHEHFDIVPDIMTIVLLGGMPIGGLVTSQKSCRYY